MSRVIVVGGGAAGMMAACAAAEAGHQVVLLEKNEKLGKKLYITGKGRCNVTNTAEKEQFFRNIVMNGKFLYSSIYQFDSQAMMAFLEEHGCRVKEERGGRVFPISDHASDVTGALQRAMKGLFVEVHLKTEVKKLLLRKDAGLEEGREDGKAEKSGKAEKLGEVDGIRGQGIQDKVCGVVLADGKHLKADAVILACGGLSYPATGSDGAGFKLAAQAGHTVTDCRPALAPLEIKEDWCRRLQGLSLKNVRLTLWKQDSDGSPGLRPSLNPDLNQSLRPSLSPDLSPAWDPSLNRSLNPDLNQSLRPSLSPDLSPAWDPSLNRSLNPNGEKHREKPLYEGFGEMLFTHFGVSGPLVLTASSYYAKECKCNGVDTSDRKKTGRSFLPARLLLDLKPALDEEKLDKRIRRDFEENSHKAFKNALGGLLPAKLIPIMVELSAINGEKKVYDITREERLSFVRLMKNLPMTVTGTRGFAEAVITQGGIPVSEINPSTMESRLCRGLYLAGEMLDVDALTGGYNLQLAWSTGHLAGGSVP